MPRFATVDDVIDRHVVPTLGEYAADFDVDAIASEVTAYRADEYPAHPGSINLSTTGLEVAVTDAEFWEIVARHDIAAD
ncbi:hypothetical protein [Brevibacterium sanguinis]|uniref:hypothetical protein n=1 Tax=Brevibacterium sanguinis TaxID=232444 RepID=UPI0031D29D1E